VVDVEPDLFGVEGLGAVHVRNRDYHYLERPVHDASPLMGVEPQLDSGC